MEIRQNKHYPMAFETSVGFVRKGSLASANDSMASLTRSTFGSPASHKVSFVQEANVDAVG